MHNVEKNISIDILMLSEKNSAKGSLDLNQIHAASTSDIVHSVDSTSSVSVFTYN